MRAKIDTGARTSAIHVDRIESLSGGRVRFDIVVRERPRRRIVTAEADVIRWSTVRPSHGGAQQRPVVRARIAIGAIEREAEISLVSREGMLCRMLIGRRALRGLLVDPGQRYLLSAPTAPPGVGGGGPLAQRKNLPRKPAP